MLGYVWGPRPKAYRPREASYVRNRTPLVHFSLRLYAEDATLLGIYLKLRLLAEVESLSSHLNDGPHLLWPRIILTILRD